MLIRDFIDTDFKDFSNHDNVRSIPSIIDGLKESQRKAVYGMFNHGNSEIKVAQLAGKAALVSHYHHGETSMADAIVGLAQSFPGSNNINLFEPIGQFGSILSPESSAHRYIFTKPSPNLRKMLPQKDDCILEYQYEDGDQIEPKHYYPVLPMWLVNGSVGIGTGHSIKVLPRDPKAVSELIKKMVDNTNVQQKTIDKLLMPCFTGWTGTVNKRDDGGYTLTGRIEKVNSTTLKVTELPVVYSIDKFKSILVGLMDSKVVKDYDNNSNENGFNLTIKVPREIGSKSEAELVKLFKLSYNLKENITLWDTNDKIKRYDSMYDALCEFVDYRIEKYNLRKQTQIDIIDEEVDFLTDKKKFIDKWNKFENAGKMSEEEIIKEMQDAGISDESIERLMLVKISSLSLSQIKKLDSEIEAKRKEWVELINSTPTDIYKADLVI